MNQTFCISLPFLHLLFTVHVLERVQVDFIMQCDGSSAPTVSVCSKSSNAAVDLHLLWSEWFQKPVLIFGYIAAE